MRAGAFTDRRVIRLINRRFIAFYFNTGGPGVGKDQAASDFVSNVLNRQKVGMRDFLIDPHGRKTNTIAYFAGFSPEVPKSAKEGGVPVANKGNGATGLLGIATGWKNEKESYELRRLYPSKEKVFEFLVELLKENPQFNQFTRSEMQVLQNAKRGKASATDRLAAAEIYEDLGSYSKAAPYLRKVIDGSGSTNEKARATVALLRIYRYQGDWNRHQDLAENSKREVARFKQIADQIQMEKAYFLLSKKRYQEAKKLLGTAIKLYPKSSRLSEMHFYSGVAAYFLKDLPTAYFHWCWIVEKMPDDRLRRRAYIAAAHKSFPYPNSELGFYRSKEMVTNSDIQAAYEDAKRHYMVMLESRKVKRAEPAKSE